MPLYISHLATLSLDGRRNGWKPSGYGPGRPDKPKKCITGFSKAGGSGTAALLAGGTAALLAGCFVVLAGFGSKLLVCRTKLCQTVLEGGQLNPKSPSACAPGLFLLLICLRHDFFGGELGVHYALDACHPVVLSDVDGPDTLRVAAQGDAWAVTNVVEPTAGTCSG